MEYYIKSSNVVFKDRIKEATVLVKNGVFKEILSYDENVEVKDYGNLMIIPGLFDSHTHGFAGYSFTSTSSVEDIQDCLVHYAKNGITSIFASSSKGGYKNIVEVIENPITTRILGIHSEGPFLSDKQRGIAKPGTHFLKPNLADTEEYYNESQGYLKMMSLAIENEGAKDVIKYLKSKGVKVAIGHSNGTYQDFESMKDSIDVATHLCNAMSGIHHRNMGVLGGILLSDLPCELIADGMHVTKPMLEIIFKMKPTNEILLVSDTTALAGVDVGDYELDYGTITVREDGVIINEFGAINGSSQMILKDVKYLVNNLNIDIVDAINMALINPCKLHGVDKELGSIEVNKLADFVIINNDFEVLETYSEGKCIYNSETVVKINERLESLLSDPSFMSSYK